MNFLKCMLIYFYQIFSILLSVGDETICKYLTFLHIEDKNYNNTNFSFLCKIIIMIKFLRCVCGSISFNY